MCVLQIGRQLSFRIHIIWWQGIYIKHTVSGALLNPGIHLAIQSIFVESVWNNTHNPPNLLVIIQKWTSIAQIPHRRPAKERAPTAPWFPYGSCGDMIRAWNHNYSTMAGSAWAGLSGADSVNNGPNFSSWFRLRLHPTPDLGTGSYRTNNLLNWTRAAYTTRNAAFNGHILPSY